MATSLSGDQNEILYNLRPGTLDALKMIESGGASDTALQTAQETEGAVGLYQQRPIFQAEIARLDPSMTGYDPRDEYQARRAASIYLRHQMDSGLDYNTALASYNAGRTGAQQGIGAQYGTNVSRVQTGISDTLNTDALARMKALETPEVTKVDEPGPPSPVTQTDIASGTSPIVASLEDDTIDEFEFGVVTPQNKRENLAPKTDKAEAGDSSVSVESDVLSDTDLQIEKAESKAEALVEWEAVTDDYIPRLPSQVPTQPAVSDSTRYAELYKSIMSDSQYGNIWEKQELIYDQAAIMGLKDYLPTQVYNTPDPSTFWAEAKEFVVAAGSGVPAGIAQGINSYLRVARATGELAGKESNISEDMLDMLIAKTDDWAATGQGQGLKYVPSVVRGGIQSFLNSTMISVPAGVVGFSIGGPFGAAVGAATSSFAIAGGAEYDRFAQNVREFYHDQFKSMAYFKMTVQDKESPNYGKEYTPDIIHSELARVRQLTMVPALLSGLAEGTFEAIGQGVAAKIVLHSAKVGIVVPGKKILKKIIADYGASAGILLSTEISTELATTVAQEHASRYAGMPPQDLIEALWHTAGVATVQSLITLGIGASYSGVTRNDISKNRAVLKAQLMAIIKQDDLSITEEQVDAWMVILDSKAGAMGMSTNEFIGATVARIDNDPSKADQGGSDIGALFQSAIPEELSARGAKVITESMPDEASPEDVIQILKDGGVTLEEMQWYGLNHFLYDRKGSMIPKQDVMDYLNLLGHHAGLKEQRFLLNDLSKVKENNPSHTKVDVETGEIGTHSPSPNENNKSKLAGATEYSGENVLFFDKEFLDFIYKNYTEEARQFLLDFDGDRNTGLQEALIGMETPGTQLLQYRYTGRSSTQGDGDIFFIENLSSPVHQNGNKNGYMSIEESEQIQGLKRNYVETLKLLVDKYLPSFPSSVNPAVMEGAWGRRRYVDQLVNDNVMAPEDATLWEQAKANNEEYNQVTQAPRKSPKVPFSKSWHTLGVLRMLSDAVEHGAKYIAWSTPRDKDIEMQWSSRDTFPLDGSVDFEVRMGADGEAQVGNVDMNAPKNEVISDIARQLENENKDQDFSTYARHLYDKIANSDGQGTYKPYQDMYDGTYSDIISNAIAAITGMDPKDIKLGSPMHESWETAYEVMKGEGGDSINSVQGIAITDKVRAKIEKARKSLFQDDKGSVEFLEDGRAIIRLGKGADISTLIHEAGHIFRRTLSPQQLAEIEGAYGVEDGLWTVEAEEKFARAFERWIRTGSVTNKSLGNIMGDFKVWMQRLYRRIKGSSLEMKMNHDMRNLFDRMLGDPNIESAIQGKIILAQVQGGYILDEDKQRDIQKLITFIASPEFAVRDNPVALSLAGLIIEAEFDATASANEDYETFHEAQRLALSDLGRMAGNRIIKKLTPERTRKQLEKVRVAMDMIMEGKNNLDNNALWNDIKSLQQKNPGVFNAAKVLIKYFEGVREDLQNYKRDMFMRTLTKPYKEAFEESMQILQRDGDITDAQIDRIVKKNKIDKKEFAGYVNEYTDIKNWGIDDYITNMERGSIKLMDQDGNTVLIAVSRKEAIRKAKEWLSRPENRHVKILQIDTSGQNFDPHAEVSRNQYWAIYSKIKKELGDTSKEIENALRAALGKGVRVEPSQKFAGPLKQRKNVLEGEKNIFDVMYSYAHVVRKKIAIDPVVHELKNKMSGLPKNVRSVLLSQLDYAKGKYSMGDQITDQILEAFEHRVERALGITLGVRPMFWTRQVGRIRMFMGAAKLGYRVVAAFINLISGQGHTWVKTGAKYIARGRKFLNTEKGKDWIDQQERYLGVNYAIDTRTMKKRTKSDWWHPLKMFSAAEFPNRRINIAAAYLQALDEGMDEGAASVTARRAVRFTQFTYNVSALPLMLRSPGGKLVGQFKPYLVKEIEFIRNLRGKEILRYIGLQMALAGPRGMLVVIRSLPYLGILGIWDDWEEWMNEEHPEIPIVGENVPSLSRGVVGLVGGDITLPATVQLPSKPEDWAGPFLSDLFRLWDDVMVPAAEGEKFMSTNLKSWLSRISPFAFYWDQAIQSVVDEGGWVKDRRSGNKLFQVDSNWQRFLMMLGVSPTERSDVLWQQRMLQKEEDLRNRNAVKTVNEFIRTLKDGEDVPMELLEDLLQLGVSRTTIKESMMRKELPPHMRIFRQTRKGARPRVIKLFNMLD